MRSSSNRRSKLRTGLSLLAVLILASAATAAVAPYESHGVRLVLGAEEIAPPSTFELRFDQTMVSPPSVGLVAPISPLVITPALPGSFVWLSQRSRVFTPREPLALGTTYQSHLRHLITLRNPATGAHAETWIVVKAL